MKELVGGLVVVAMASAGCALGDPTPDVDTTPAYLALGDSIAFGYDPHVPQQAGVTGYPETLGASMGLEVTNASCPGEASGGFISATGTDNGCRENRAAYPLHVDYDGTQLAFAIEFLRSHPNTQLVTIDLGANDAKKLQNECAGSSGCVLGGFVGMLTKYVDNMKYIVGELRKEYDGPLVALQIYNPFPTDSLSQYGVERLNTTLSNVVANTGIVADGRTSFASAGGDDPCKAGLLIPMSDGTCDIHPTPKGHELLSNAIESAMGAPQ